MSRSAIALDGLWHLVSDSWSGGPVPQHRMDLRFWTENGVLKAAVVSRTTGLDMPMVQDVTFDGSVLRLQLVAPEGRTQDEMPFLTMEECDDAFRGPWMQGGEELGPPLKLVPAPK